MGAYLNVQRDWVAVSGLSVKSSDNNISYGIQWNGPDHILPGLPIGSSASYFYWLTPLHPCRVWNIPPPHVFNFFIHNILCFNYIANIIKLMICVKLLGNDGYAGMRITCRGMRDMWWRDGDMRDMRDGPPPRNRPGRAAVFDPAPPNPRRTGNRNSKQPAIRKRMLILYLTC